MPGHPLLTDLATEYEAALDTRPIEVGDVCIEKLSDTIDGYAVFTAVNRNERNDYPNIRVLRRSGTSA
ncbi:hypothetical protein [Brachybacterium paraconglomeratum]|uniref:hypothetical protein n=1 Tax=Brachybacterium paraconglomeratum TaxID=173362 RepID=UPI0022E3D6CB|nr:hypothetical protein [Brachybacterium paraconglomeratum]